MADIPRFTPSDLGGQQFTHNPGSVASAVESSFYRAQENVRQNDESDRADARLAMQQQEFGMRQEENAYQQTLRPLREQQMQLGLASQGLQLANQSLGLQSAQLGIKGEEMRMLQQEQEMNFLTGNLSWMSDQRPSDMAGTLTDRVKQFEGFNAEAYGDFKQTSIGYGTRARPGEKAIDEATASARLQEELSMHSSNVDKAAAKFGVTLSPNQRDALTSFDYNTGSAERVLERSGGDLSKVPGIMQEWRRAGGEVLPGLVKRRQAEAAWFQSGGTGVPSLSQVTAATTPTGVPVIAAAANSLNPGEVITQSFAPEQQQALARFDQVSALAQTASTPQARSLAAQEMNLMRNDPRMVATLAQRDEMVRSTQAQVQVQGMIQSAPDDLVRGFETRYGNKFRLSNMDGRQVPVNAQGNPLNSQEYAAFSRAFTDYSADYKFDPQAATAELRNYEAAIPKLAQIAAFQREGPPTLQSFLAPGGGEPLTPADGDAYETQLKAYNTALTNYNQQSQAVRQNAADLAIQAARNPQIATALRSLFPAPQAASTTAAPAAAPTPAARPSIEDLARGPVQTDTVVDEVWTEGKRGLTQELELSGYQDNGQDSTDNPALRLAAQVYQQGASRTVGPTDPRGAALEATGRNPQAPAFEVKGRMDAVSNVELLRAWAEDVLIKYGRLDPRTKRPPSQSAPATQSRIKSITPVN